MADRWELARIKNQAVRDAEAAGIVADSMEVRKAIMARFHAGEITLPEAQAELSRIQRSAKRNGKTTRSAVFNAAR